MTPMQLDEEGGYIVINSRFHRNLRLWPAAIGLRSTTTLEASQPFLSDNADHERPRLTLRNQEAKPAPSTCDHVPKSPANKSNHGAHCRMQQES